MKYLQDIKPKFPLKRIALAGLAFSFFAAYIGPFGTYTNMGLQARFMFWFLDCLGISVFSVLTLYVLHRSFTGLSITSLVGLSAMITAFPGAFYIRWLFPFFSGGRDVSASVPNLALDVLIITTTVLTLHFILDPLITKALTAQHPEVAPKPEQKAKLSAPIFAQLPHDMRNAEIISISMEDHYAKIRTTQGEHLKLMRLSDALEHLGEISGAQIHRSHWVAEAFAEALEKVGRKHEITLTDGSRLPVSNTYLDAARNLLDGS